MLFTDTCRADIPFSSVKNGRLRPVKKMIQYDTICEKRLQKQILCGQQKGMIDFMLYQDLLDSITDKSRQIFQDALTGVYLHGSLAMGCFHPVRSDLDFIVVLREPISDRQKLQFMNHIMECRRSAPAKGIEFSIVMEKFCREFLYPTPFELHFSNVHLQWFLDNPDDYIRKMNGTDKDLAAHFRIIQSYGIVLYGAPIDDVFGVVPRADYIDSILSDIKDAREEILKQPVYMILNLCRTAAFLKDDLVLSKKQGGEWALQNIPAQYHDIVSEALTSYASENDMRVISLKAQAFADYMLNGIYSAVRT